MSSCLTVELKRALLAQVGCGIPELHDFLACEIDFIWEIQDECLPRLRYIYTQLGLIEIAQIFARNKIDTMTREASSQMNERYTAFSTHQSDAERDATGRSCSWAAATSSQFFNRDSQDQSIGWTDYRHQYTSEIDNNGYDSSFRHTTGFGFHNTNVASSFHSDTVDQDVSFQFDESSASGGTNGLDPILGLTWATIPTLVPVMPTMPEVDPIVPAEGEFDLCPYNDVVDPELPPTIFECKQGYPSKGQGFHGTFTWSLVLPPIGTLSITWNQAENSRQFFTCSRSVALSNGAREWQHDLHSSGATDASPDDNQTYSSEVSNIFHNVRKYGVLTRRSTTANDGEEHALGTSSGIANSESERNSQGVAYNKSRAEAEAVRHSESHFRRTEKANNDMMSAKYGQISKHLKALWGRVWHSQLQLERQFSAVPYSGTMNCPVKGKSCLPVRRSWQDHNRVMPHV